MSDSIHRIWTIDAVEEGIARIEEDGERIIRIPRYLLPTGAREGQILRVTSKPGKSKTELTIEIDEAAAARHPFDRSNPLNGGWGEVRLPDGQIIKQ